MNTTRCLVAIALMMIGSTVAAAGECVSVRIDTPIVMPDGSDRAAGVLRVCNTQSFSPVASLHATSIDGKSIGLLQSRKLRSEASETTPFFVFDRFEDGRMRWVGYVVPASGGRGSVTYQLAPSTVPGAMVAGSSLQTDVGKNDRADGSPVTAGLATLPVVTTVSAANPK